MLHLVIGDEVNKLRSAMFLKEYVNAANSFTSTCSADQMAYVHIVGAGYYMNFNTATILMIKLNKSPDLERQVQIWSSLDAFSMEYVYAALLLHKLKQNITEDSVKSVVQAAGVTPDDVRVKALVAALSEVQIDEVLKAAPVAVAAAAPAAAGAAASTAAPAAGGTGAAGGGEASAKEEEKKEEEALEGLSSLFGQVSI